MKVLLFNGSPREKGNTAHALRAVAAVLEAEGIGTELIHVGAGQLQSCTGCNSCAKLRDGKCTLPDDGVNGWIEKMREADGFLLGSPVYFGEPTAVMKAFLDRAFFAAGNSGNLFRFKAGAALVVLRRPGGRTALDALLRYFGYAEMIVPFAANWNMVFGLKPGEAEQDVEGMQAARNLGRNLAWLLKAMELGKANIPVPEFERRAYTSMIR